MTAPISLWPTVVTAIVAAMRAQAGYQAPTSTGSDMVVFDGAEVSDNVDTINEYVVIGWSGDPDSPSDAGQTTQGTTRHAPTRPRDENGTITCRIVCQLNDVDAIQARTTAYGMADDLAQLLIADPRVGIAASGTTQLLWALVTEVTPRQYKAGGSICDLLVTVTYLAHL
jgi:hypothetical protein